MFNLTNRTALITGASGGIGKEIALHLHNMGANVIVTGTKEPILIDLCNQLGSRAAYLAIDLSDHQQLDNLYSKAESLFGNIDTLVCNAGITLDNLTIRMKDEDWDKVLQINLTATFKLNRAAIKSMAKNKFGRIINITSVVASSGNFGQANYVAAKAGVTGMTKCIAKEMASRNITANCIAPGFIKTPMTDVLKDEIKNHLINEIPAKRMGEAKEIASAVVYLASEEASYVTGTTLHVNGGLYM